MIVLIDAGNTRVKAGWVDPGTGQRESQPVALTHDMLDQLSYWLSKLPSPITRAIGVSVAGSTIETIIENIFHLHECPIEWIKGESHALNLTNAY